MLSALEIFSVCIFLFIFIIYINAIMGFHYFNSVKTCVLNNILYLKSHIRLLCVSPLNKMESSKYHDEARLAIVSHHTLSRHVRTGPAGRIVIK